MSETTRTVAAHLAVHMIECGAQPTDKVFLSLASVIDKFITDGVTKLVEQPETRLRAVK